MENNPDRLPLISRTIASAIVISRDGKVLMGRKDPHGGGVYADVWHIPGGGVEPGESLEQAMRRELSQEVLGINLKNAQIEQLDNIGKGEAIRLIDGKKYWCQMEFNRFMVILPGDAEVLSESLEPGDDLVELKWFGQDELASVKQIPGGKEFFEEIGLIK